MLIESLERTDEGSAVLENASHAKIYVVVELRATFGRHLRVFRLNGGSKISRLNATENKRRMRSELFATHARQSMVLKATPRVPDTRLRVTVRCKAKKYSAILPLSVLMAVIRIIRNRFCTILWQSDCMWTLFHFCFGYLWFVVTFVSDISG